MYKKIILWSVCFFFLAGGYSCVVYERYLIDNIDTKYPEVRGYIEDLKPATDIVMASVEDTWLPGPRGLVPVRIYIPQVVKKGAVLIMYMHGGGYVIGSYTMVDRVARMLSRDGQCVVVSVNYALAPEYPYPAALNDCEAVFEYLSLHAGEYKSSADKIVVAGESAGANLSTVLCLKRRDEGKSLPWAQMLFSPPVGGINPETGEVWKTKEANAKKGILTSRSMKIFSEFYLGDPVLYQNDPYVNPITAASLAGLPQALVVTCGNDPLCEEGQAYAAMLEASGVKTLAAYFPTKEHAYQGREVMAVAIAFLGGL